MFVLAILISLISSAAYAQFTHYCGASAQSNSTSFSCSGTVGNASFIWGMANDNVSSYLCNLNGSSSGTTFLAELNVASNFDIVGCWADFSTNPNTTTGFSWTTSAAVKAIRAAYTARSYLSETQTSSTSSGTSLVISAATQKCDRIVGSAAIIGIFGSLPTVTVSSGWSLLGGSWQTSTYSTTTRSVAIYHSSTHSSLTVTLSAARAYGVIVARICQLEAGDDVLWLD